VSGASWTASKNRAVSGFRAPILVPNRAIQGGKPQILGGEGEAVVLYRESLTTQEMWYPRLSLWLNKMAVSFCFQDATWSGFQKDIKNEGIAGSCSF
jgi:hypothetical protein